MNFNKWCSNCEFSSIHDYGYGKEIYCNCNESKSDNVYEIIDEFEVGSKCGMFKNKHIYNDDNTLFYVEEEYARGSYISCESNNYNLLNSFISREDELKQKIEKKTEKIKELNNFLSFIKSELPDVYKRLWKEFCNSKNANILDEDEVEKARYDTNGEMLETGESQRPDGRYRYTWRADGKQQEVCALTLAELRGKEREIQNGK